nr:hypothetical protein [Tanacetum cinerariifolium]
GSPRADDHEHLELPEMLEDPYVESPEYVPESDLEAHPEDDDDEDPEEDPVDYLVDVGDDGDDEEGSSEDDKDDDIDIEANEEEEEHPAPADSVVVASTSADQAPSVEETEPFETDESAATPPLYPAYRMTARISIPTPVPMPAWSDSEIVRLLAMSSLPASPLSPWSSPPPRIPFPPLPPILSPPSPVLSPAPPPSPIYFLGYRAAMIRLEDRPEVTLPPRKKLGIALGPRYEVGESSSVAAARPAGGLRADYRVVATMDREIMRDPERESLRRGLGKSERQLLAGRLNMLFRDRRVHAYTRHLMETEAMMSREAWVQSTDASDLVRGEVMSLRTIVLGQMIEIRKLHAAERRRQTGLAGSPTQPELPEEAGSGS